MRTSIVESMEKESIASAIIVVKNKASNYAKQATKRFEPVFHLELFYENDLLVDITEHFLVLPHILRVRRRRRRCWRVSAFLQINFPS